MTAALFAALLVTFPAENQKLPATARTYAIGAAETNRKERLYLNGVEDFSIVREDTLAHPAFVDGSHLRKFDIVLANPPYSIKTWNREAFMNDKWGRNFLGTPPQGRADYAFIQHIIASMNTQHGGSATLLPHGVLFRDEEKELRKKMVESDVVDCIIGLGPNLFYNSPMEACIIICSNNKPAERKGKILMINAINDVVRQNAESKLLPEHIERITRIYHSSTEIDGYSKLVSNEDLAKKDYNLNISLYAYRSQFVHAQTSLDVSLSAWEECSQSVSIEYNTLMKMLEP